MGTIPVVATLGVIFLVAFLVLVRVVKNILYISPPNQVLVFSGRGHYRIFKGGRALRWPLIEVVDRMDLTNMIIEVGVRGAYSKGGIPLSVQGVANIKIPGEQPLLDNALERFLGKTREQIMQVARENLEGNLRGVLSTLTPEQVNQDKEAFAMKLTDEAGHDLNRIGLVLDTLKIQSVSDDVGYLDAIGRMRSAQIKRNAQVAEAEAAAQAAQVKWQNYMQGELAKLEAQIQVARTENQRRIADATTRREAMIAEQRAHVQADIAQAKAEAGMQVARIEQTRLQLEADVVQPANAAMKEAQARAKADAARVIEQGKATAKVLSDLAQTYRGAGDAGRDVLLMQKLAPLLQQVSGTIKDLRVDRLTVIGAGQGAGSSGALASKLVSTLEQVRAATGVDLAQALRERLGAMASASASAAAAPVPPPLLRK